MNKLATICIIVVIAFGIVARASAQTEEIRALMADMNKQLEAMGENVRIASVEYYTAWEKAGQIVYFDDRTLRMGSDWVPFDPRRYGERNIYWLSDQVDGKPDDVSLEDTQAAIDQAMATWNTVACANIPLIKVPDYGMDWGIVQYLVGMGGNDWWLADITHAGWLPGIFFDIIDPDPGPPPGSEYILGATFTAVWVDTSTDEPTDIDNNGKEDVAFREVYYNNAFVWGIDPGWPFIDVETVVLHEMGHGLSLAHFGKLFKTDKNGKFHFAPRAVMNAGYTGVQQDLTGTDLAGHCSIWASWPYN